MFFFSSADDIILKMHGNQLTQRYLEKHGFDVPIMVPKLDGLGLRLPPPTFSVLDVERYVGMVCASAEREYSKEQMRSLSW